MGSEIDLNTRAQKIIAASEVFYFFTPTIRKRGSYVLSTENQ